MEERIGVLVIDDEPSVGDALKLILDDHGYRAVVARNGRDGLEQARKRQFDVTITDLRLPDMSGLDVLNAILKQDSDNLVIVITAYGTSEVIFELMSCGAVDVLPKPFFPSDILKIINTALKNREQKPQMDADQATAKSRKKK
jgi:two-component system response regulator PilR (NtrC family)